jgi:hypothetical protein
MTPRRRHHVSIDISANSWTDVVAALWGLWLRARSLRGPEDVVISEHAVAALLRVDITPDVPAMGMSPGALSDAGTDSGSPRT